MVITLNSIDNNYSSYNFTAKKSAKSEQPVQQTVQQADVPAKEKKSFGRGFRNFFAGIQKFFISAGEYIKGAAKGIFFGGLSAAAIVGVSAIKNRSNEVKIFGEAMNKRAILKSPLKATTKGKVIAGAVGIGIVGLNLFKSYLNSNEKGAKVDHRWNTGHKEV